MKSLSFVASAATVVLLGACATTGGKSTTEMTPGKFVAYACEGDKSFQARFNAETGTVRVRTKEGGAELSKGDRGLYRDSDPQQSEWILTLREGSDSELVYNGKAIYKKCAVQGGQA